MMDSPSADGSQGGLPLVSALPNTVVGGKIDCGNALRHRWGRRWRTAFIGSLGVMGMKRVRLSLPGG